MEVGAASKNPKSQLHENFYSFLISSFSFFIINSQSITIFLNKLLFKTIPLYSLHPQLHFNLQTTSWYFSTLANNMANNLQNEIPKLYKSHLISSLTTAAHTAKLPFIA